MIKKIMAQVIIGCLLLAGCGKVSTEECTPVSPASEEPAIIAYDASQGFTAIKDSNGLYYQILIPGTGAVPTVNSMVTVQYTGKRFDGYTFDSNTTPAGVQFPLYKLIQGWQTGLPLIQAGGKIRLMVPSAYAYGCQGTTNIPANTPLFFEITLLAVN